MENTLDKELTVIMAADLLLVLTFRVQDDFGKKLSKNVFEQLRCEGHFRPIVALFHDIQNIPCPVIKNQR